MGRMFNGASTSCTHNPTIGYEREYGFESLAPQRDQPERDIVVVGAGPAGLEAARVAASLGHRVTVLEQGDDIGGQLRLVSRTPQRAEWGELIRYFRVQLERLGVDVRLNTTATREMVLGMAPDGVVFAAGSEPVDPGIASDGSARMLPDWEVFDLDVPRHSRIVVLAEEDHHESPSIAEYLADLSYSVDLVTSAPVVGRAIDIAGLPPLLRRLDEKQVRAHTSASIRRVVEGTVVLDPVRGQEVRRLEDVAAIVVCGLRKARTELYHQLVSSEVPVELVGDARAPRRANEAIREGHWAGRSVSKALTLHA